MRRLVGTRRRSCCRLHALATRLDPGHKRRGRSRYVAIAGEGIHVDDHWALRSEDHVDPVEVEFESAADRAEDAEPVFGEPGSVERERRAQGSAVQGRWSTGGKDVTPYGPQLDVPAVEVDALLDDDELLAPCCGQSLEVSRVVDR